MAHRGHGRKMRLVSIGEERAGVVQFAQPVLIRRVEARHIVVTELIDDDRDHQLGLGCSRLGRLRGKQQEKRKKPTACDFQVPHTSIMAKGRQLW